MPTRINRVQFTAAAPGLTNITVGSASAGFRTLGSGQNGQSFDGVVISDGTNWEVRNGCTYTHAGTSLSRGTLEDSSSGSAINFASAVTVFIDLSAQTQQRYDAAALEHVAGSNAAVSMAVNTMYVVDGSALTANRTYTLPAVCAVGDRCGVMLTSGNASFAVLLTAASGDTLNGVAGGTEWSRLFIANEVVIMRCVTANSTWIVEEDGRIPCYLKMVAASSQTGVASSTWTTVTQGATGSWSVPINVGGMADTANHSAVIRRSGNYQFTLNLNLDDLSDVTSFLVGIQKNATGAALRAGRQEIGRAGAYPQALGSVVVTATPGDSYRMQFFHNSSGSKVTSWLSNELENTLLVQEIL